MRSIRNIISSWHDLIISLYLSCSLEMELIFLATLSNSVSSIYSLSMMSLIGFLIVLPIPGWKLARNTIEFLIKDFNCGELLEFITEIDKLIISNLFAGSSLSSYTSSAETLSTNSIHLFNTKLPSSGLNSLQFMAFSLAARFWTCLKFGCIFDTTFVFSLIFLFVILLNKFFQNMFSFLSYHTHSRFISCLNKIIALLKTERMPNDGVNQNSANKH